MSASSVMATPTPAPGWLMPVMALAVIGAITGATLGSADVVDSWRWLHWIGKPLATVLILLSVWQMRTPVSRAYRQRILVGILFSLAGDIFLMLSPRWFIAGLLGFLLAHGWFIAAFLTDKPLRERPLSWLLCLALGAIAVAVLWPALDLTLRVAVPVYIAVLATMAGQALGRARWMSANGNANASTARSAAIGALVFMLSDGLLAWNQFMAPLPAAAVAVLGTYYVAMWRIARSVDAHDQAPVSGALSS